MPNTEMRRSIVQLFFQDTVRIQICRDDVDALHCVGVASGNLLQRSKQVIGETARRCKDGQLASVWQPRLQLWFDLRDENLQPIVDCAVK